MSRRRARSADHSTDLLRDTDNVSIRPSGGSSCLDCIRPYSSSPTSPSAQRQHAMRGDDDNAFVANAVGCEQRNGKLDSPLPEHLVVMVNGIAGSASNWKFAADQFKLMLGNKVTVHCSACNALTLTFDGVDVMGHRLAEEVKTVINQLPGITKISFLAHSLGGLVARYAIGQLYDLVEGTTLLHTFRRNESGEGTNGSEGDNTNISQLQGTIAGLQPINFITVATPHLGSRGNRQLPFLCGVPFFEKAAVFSAHWFVGRTGRHLFLTDDDKSQLPLLRRMVTDCGEGQFISALKAFKRCATYANVCYDHMVGWRTASIRRECELPVVNTFPVNEKYPHVVRVESVYPGGDDASSNKGSALDADEEEMIAGLRQASWQRVDVNFHGSPQMLAAHNTIQVKYYWMHSEGADVIAHIIDNFIV
eukprot:c23817_g1_i1 orf=214-1476(+)